MHTGRTRWSVATLLFVAAPVWAQGICTIEDTFASCERKVSAQSNAQSAANQQQAANNLLAKTNTGADASIDEHASSAFTDFFPLLKLAAGLPDTGEDGDAAWVIALNRCTPGSRQPSVVQCQWRARVGGGTLYEPLKQALPEATRAVRATELEEGIGAFEGSQIGFFLNLENERFGRRLRFDEDAAFFDALLTRAQTANAGELQTARARKDMVYAFTERKIETANRDIHVANTRMARRHVAANALDQARVVQLEAAFGLLGTMDADGNDGSQTYNRVVAALNDALRARGVEELFKPVFDPFDESQPFKEMPADIGAMVMPMWEDSVRTDVGAGRSVLQSLRRSGYFDAYRLANNQPQWSFGVDFHPGSDLVGPDEVRAKLSWEFGYSNLNDLKRYSGPSGQCSARAASKEQDARAACLGEYLARDDVRADMAAGDRFALVVEYAHRDRYAAQSPGDGVALDLPSERSLIASLVWGRYLNLLQNEDFGASRFDLVASYEDVGSDPARQDRGIGSLTLSQELTGGLVLSVAVQYESKPEFSTNVDEEWSSRISLNYKMGAPNAE